MVWFQVDDNLAFHPKVLEAGNAAMGLWVRAGAWSMANLTDGYIPARVAYQLGTRKMCDHLVKVKLFEETLEGYRFHDWEDKQFTKIEVETRRRRDRARKSEQRKSNVVRMGHHAESAGNPSGVTSAIPTQPNPTLINGQFEGETHGDYRAPPGPASAGPPQKFCPEHPGGTEQPCRPCATARQRYETWEANEATRAATNRRSRRTAIETCDYCDQTGMRETPDGMTRCTHQPDSFEELF